jgi:hypothetical protein
MTHHQWVSKIREDGDRRDACPACLTARAAEPLTAWIRLKLELQRASGAGIFVGQKGVAENPPAL